MSKIMLPPKITYSDFRFLATSQKSAIEAHFGPLVSELQAYLNQTGPLADVQRVREVRAGGRAFVRPARVETHHWWFSHHGGRNEAQWNVGMFPSHLRVGIGFNASGGGYGKPAEVEDALMRFLEALREQQRKRPDVVAAAKLEVETFDPNNGLRSTPLSELLDSPPQGLKHWLFIGRLLRSGIYADDGLPLEAGKEVDLPVLEDPDLFAEELNRSVAGLWPAWEQSRRG